MSDLLPFPADGVETEWTTADGKHRDTLALQWDNEAWTATVGIGRHDVEFVVRLSPLWEVRQVLLFRDLDQPDLWIGTDGSGRWGEVNGAHRPDLDGAFDVVLAGSPFGFVIPIRRLPLGVGEAADLRSLRIDVETLGIVPVDQRYERIAHRRWRVTTAGDPAEFTVDDHGLPTDLAFGV